MNPPDITQHEGKKYLRLIRRPKGADVAYRPVPDHPYRPEVVGIEVDVYAVLEAFRVNDQAVGHAVKKLLCAGDRGKGDRLADLKGALAAVARAVEMEEAAEADRRRRKEEFVRRLAEESQPADGFPPPSVMPADPPKES